MLQTRRVETRVNADPFVSFVLFVVKILLTPRRNHARQAARALRRPVRDPITPSQ